MSIALITLTHAGEGPYVARQDKQPYSGRVILDASRVESIEEVLVEGEAPLTFVTTSGGSCHGVAETPDQIIDLMTKVMNAGPVSQVNYSISARDTDDAFVRAQCRESAQTAAKL